MTHNIMELKILALRKPVALGLTAGLVAAGSIAPLLHSQIVTGTIVNATLFLAAILLDRKSAAGVAALPSLIALAAGTLPAVLAPMVPFIILGNLLLAAVFRAFSAAGFAVAGVGASLAKFGFLAAASRLVLGAAMDQPRIEGVIHMMSYPQLATALLGLAAAYAVFRGLHAGKLV